MMSFDASMRKPKPFIYIRLNPFALGFDDDDTQAQHYCADGVGRLLLAKYPIAEVKCRIDPKTEHQGHFSITSGKFTWGQYQIDVDEVQDAIRRAIDMCDGVSKVVKP